MDLDYNPIEAPNLKQIGVQFAYEQIDCDYMHNDHENCPIHKNDIPKWSGTSNCPILIGNPPCESAKKIKIKFWIIKSITEKTISTRLDKFIGGN